MKAKHFVTNFVSPSLFYMAIVLYGVSAVSILLSGKDPDFLVVGFITFVLAYNSWHFATKARGEQ